MQSRVDFGKIFDIFRRGRLNNPGYEFGIMTYTLSTKVLLMIRWASGIRIDISTFSMEPKELLFTLMDKTAER